MSWGALWNSGLTSWKIKFCYVYDRVIAAAKKTYLKDKPEESWLKNGIGERNKKVKV